MGRKRRESTPVEDDSSQSSASSEEEEEEEAGEEQPDTVCDGMCEHVGRAAGCALFAGGLQSRGSVLHSTRCHRCSQTLHSNPAHHLAVCGSTMCCYVMLMCENNPTDNTVIRCVIWAVGVWAVRWMVIQQPLRFRMQSNALFSLLHPPTLNAGMLAGAHMVVTTTASLGVFVLGQQPMAAAWWRWRDPTAPAPRPLCHPPLSLCAAPHRSTPRPTTPPPPPPPPPPART